MPPTRIVIDRGLSVPVGDGVTLATDVYRPEGRPATAIVLRTPYDRTFLAQHARELDPVRAAAAGFAVVLQDVRGRAGSGGTYDFFASDADDGVMTLAWTARQRWCDGRVAMAGGSYNGIVQLLAAARRPRHLRAIAPRLCGSPYRIWYPGGALSLGFAALWIENLVAWELERRSRLDERVAAEAEEAIAALAGSPLTLIHTLLEDGSWLRRLIPHAVEWLHHDTLDEFWVRFHVSNRLDPALPSLHVSGWFDACLEPMLETYEPLRGSEVQHLVIGPWAHGNTHGLFHERSFGGAASADAIDLVGHQLRFFDHYAADRGGAVPPVRVYAMGEDRWKELDRWPPAGAWARTYHLAGPGRLSPEAPSDHGSDAYVHDPVDPVPTVGGATLLAGSAIAANSGPRDQRSLADRDDVLVYTSAVLDGPLHVVGRALVRLFADTDARDADFVVKLIDVDPGGRAMCVCDGIVRASARDGGELPTPIEPGRVLEYRISLGSTYHVFAAGHRIRLQVASSDFPRFYPNPGSGHRLRDGPPPTQLVARMRVHHGGSYPSSMSLTVAP